MPSPFELELKPLVDHPNEDLATEIKDWLDLSDRVVRADVARELIALANHGGGYLLFGFAEATDGWSPSLADQVDLAHNQPSGQVRCPFRRLSCVRANAPVPG